MWIVWVSTEKRDENFKVGQWKQKTRGNKRKRLQFNKDIKNRRPREKCWLWSRKICKFTTSLWISSSQCSKLFIINFFSFKLSREPSKYDSAFKSGGKTREKLIAVRLNGISLCHDLFLTRRYIDLKEFQFIIDQIISSRMSAEILG